MIRFLLFAILLYIFFLFVSSLFNTFFGQRRRRSPTSSPEEDVNVPPKPKVEYKNVEDAKFKDIPESKPPEPSN